MRRSEIAPGVWEAEMVVLPAVVLCMLITPLVALGGRAGIQAAAPVLPALALIATWLFRGLVREQSTVAVGPVPASLDAASAR